MKEEFKKWLCKKANFIHYDLFEETSEMQKLTILIKAMWAINREDEYIISCVDKRILLFHSFGCPDKIFYYSDYNNSEEEALEAALYYIWEQESKND